jgi:hypothetical protein
MKFISWFFNKFDNSKAPVTSSSAVQDELKTRLEENKLPIAEGKSFSLETAKKFVKDQFNYDSDLECNKLVDSCGFIELRHSLHPVIKILTDNIENVFDRPRVTPAIAKILIKDTIEAKNPLEVRDNLKNTKILGLYDTLYNIYLFSSESKIDEMIHDNFPRLKKDMSKEQVHSYVTTIYELSKLHIKNVLIELDKIEGKINTHGR